MGRPSTIKGLVHYGFRLSEDLAQKIQASSAKNQRSVSEEIRFRLEASFLGDWIVAEIKKALLE